tara:strand:- start:13598 stop:13816 length:219 start_codon:yes stop_codon:yes gene_type:complete
MIATGYCCFGESYIVEIAITKQSSTACDYRPKTFPFALFGPRDTAATFNIPFVRVVVGAQPTLDGGSHVDVV